jgi:predicted ATPase/class 3 adenylate cyclase
VAVASEFLTFLFTDLEGSTALWERHPAAMEPMLALHDAALRSAVEANAGSVVKSTGDGLHAVFRSARDGVRAAIDGQRALADVEWGDGIDVRVRMGVHAGEAAERDGDWYGTEVNRAARVMSVAHGGQIVCTRIIEELVRDDFDLVDLGEHRLRDLQSTVHLFQVEIPGAPAVHPPLRSLDAHLTNLPYELSSFIGREDDLDDVAERLGESRLVTIVGVGGVGKTRLALEVGGALLPDHDDGVWLCELAPVSDPDDITDAIAASLRYTPPPGVPVATGLQQHLERKRLLLVLDNCEHLVGAVAEFVTDTTARAPAVSVLATSREALGVRGEHIYPLTSLSVPSTPDADAVLMSEAGALFTSRAREAGGNVNLDERNSSAIHSLCRRLDGIPLALELAAAQTALMTPAEIERRIDKQFATVTGGRRGALERHQTLRAAIDWSYDLLTPAAQSLLQRLSVCVGGFDLDAALALAEGIEADGFDLLRELVAKSLVERYEANANTRYRLLEMIRQHAAEHLARAGNTAAIRDRHATHYADRLIELITDARSDDEYDVLELVAIETPNIATGLRWWTATGRASDVVACFDRMPFLDSFALPTVALDELTAVARIAIESPDVEHQPGYSEACVFVSFLAFMNGDIDDYRRLQMLANTRGTTIAGAITDTIAAMFDGELVGAVERAQAGVDLARAGGDDAQLAWLLAELTIMETILEHSTGGETRTAAIAHAEEALAIAQRVPGTIVRLYPLLAVVEANKSLDPDRALWAADQMAQLDRTQRRWWATIATNSAANARAAVGDVIGQIALWRTAVADYDEHNERFMLAMLLATVSDTLAAIDEQIAIELAAIAESGAIAPAPTFTVQPALLRLAGERPDDVSAARTRAAPLSYRESVDRVLERIDTLLAEHSPADDGAT